MVSRLFHKQFVVGSIPISGTNLINRLMNDKIINTLRAGDKITWSNGPLKFTEKTFKASSGKLAVRGAFNNEIPLTAIRVPIKKVK